MIVRQTPRRGPPRVILVTPDEELARIIYALRCRAARAGTRTELAADSGALVAAETSERAQAFHAAGRAPRQPLLF